MAYDTFTNQKERREKGTGRHLNLQINLAKLEAVRRKEGKWLEKERKEGRRWIKEIEVGTERKEGEREGSGGQGEKRELERKEAPRWR